MHYDGLMDCISIWVGSKFIINVSDGVCILNFDGVKDVVSLDITKKWHTFVT